MSFFSDLGDSIGNSLGDLFNGNFQSSLDDSLKPMENSLPFGWGDKLQNNILSPVENFVSNDWQFGIDQWHKLGHELADDPTRLLTGFDPISTGISNGIWGTDNKPLTNQFGPTQSTYDYAAGRGTNTEDAAYTAAAAKMVGAYYAAPAIFGAGASAYDAAFPTEAAGSAGSSALSDAAGVTAGGGTGSSATAWDAGQIPGWTGASAVAGNATSGAAFGAGNAEDNGTNPWTGALKGGLTGGIGSGLDYAGYAGIDNPYLKSALNGGVSGGVRAGMSDPSQTGYGALVGMLGGLANKGASAIGNYFSSSPTTGGSSGSGLGGVNWGNLATGLGNLYMTNKNNQGIQSQINSLNGLYAPNSAYATQMQQALDRQDAAGGRRSQYGTRAVELQAQLANAASRNAPTLANLYAQQRQNRFTQYAGLLSAAQKSGLGNMFSGGSQAPAVSPQINAGSFSYDQPQTAADQYLTGLGSGPDYSSYGGY